MTRPCPQLGRAFRVISERQQAWARKSAIPFGRDYCVAKIEENLFRPLKRETREEFASADGRELDGKLKKLYSSAALVANVFDYWRDQPSVPAACFDLRANTCMSFEKSRSIFDGILPYDPQRKNPNIDVEFSLGDSSKNVALECKFAEPFMKYPQTKPAPASPDSACSQGNARWSARIRDQEGTESVPVRHHSHGRI